MEKLANITFVALALAGVVGAAHTADGLAQFASVHTAGSPDHTVSTLTGLKPGLQ
ncbi:hypothetical protein HNQ50_004220 [Silvimonas terrae]|uniref:Uncharacterized protein n=1 Tax=Silvimonas terrae TaxID=300266 RepID=A0A840RMR7_9NEIS|nr:hypothetical protein [Silvimonas terrae]MBB5193463.1 hypothetical protein [Silvimonas terrae]